MRRYYGITISKAVHLGIGAVRAADKGQSKYIRRGSRSFGNVNMYSKHSFDPADYTAPYSFALLVLYYLYLTRAFNGPCKTIISHGNEPLSS